MGRGGDFVRILDTCFLKIGDFDVLIAATAMHAGMTLVTDNARHFERIQGLAVEGYRGD